ncbi:hypothetical protein TNCV_3284061 [Trichonephila clavipes]|nr:hypothetical protein TNCV_3284061 [Trichonephila clavipes]
MHRAFLGGLNIRSPYYYRFFGSQQPFGADQTCQIRSSNRIRVRLSRSLDELTSPSPQLCSSKVRTSSAYRFNVHENYDEILVALGLEQVTKLRQCHPLASVITWPVLLLKILVVKIIE